MLKTLNHWQLSILALLAGAGLFYAFSYLDFGEDRCEIMCINSPGFFSSAVLLILFTVFFSLAIKRYHESKGRTEGEAVAELAKSNIKINLIFYALGLVLILIIIWLFSGRIL